MVGKSVEEIDKEIDNLLKKFKNTTNQSKAQRILVLINHYRLCIAEKRLSLLINYKARRFGGLFDKME